MSSSTHSDSREATPPQDETTLHPARTRRDRPLAYRSTLGSPAKTTVTPQLNVKWNLGQLSCDRSSPINWSMSSLAEPRRLRSASHRLCSNEEFTFVKACCAFAGAGQPFWSNGVRAHDLPFKMLRHFLLHTGRAGSLVANRLKSLPQTVHLTRSKFFRLPIRYPGPREAVSARWPCPTLERFMLTSSPPAATAANRTRLLFLRSFLVN